MALEKDFKRKIRDRMVATGERYTQARAVLEGNTPTSAPVDVRRRWVELLADKQQAHGARRLLSGLPEHELREVALPGLDDERWQVRRHCARLLDDTSLVPEVIDGLQRLLDDEHPEVRRAAMHTLTCEHCKPDGCALDFRPLHERAIRDPSKRVRKGVVGGLTWKNEDDWTVAMLEYVRDNDASEELRTAAQRGLARIERQRETNAARLQLPDDLRLKTERHRGKWVAIADGRIIAAGWSGSVRKAVRGMRRPDAQVYWVPEE
jgi:hypothetical protein